MNKRFTLLLLIFSIFNIYNLNANRDWVLGISEESKLMKAVKSSPIEKIKELLEKGENPNYYGYSDFPAIGYTALQYAIDRRSPEIIKLLIDFGADVNALVTGALFSYNIDMVNQNVRNNPILQYAIVTDAPTDIVKILIDSGANVNGTSNLWSYNWTALMLVAYYGKIDIVKMLLEAKADPNLKNKGGQTALDVARNRNNKEIVEILSPITKNI